AAANDLILSGCGVVVFEALPEPGGMLRVGIPSYRLPPHIITAEIDILKRLGVEIRLNTALGRDVTLYDLNKDYDAILIAAGAHRAKLMKVKGEDLEGVFPGIVFLRKLSLGQPVDVRGKQVAVIGGGFTAADVARSAMRLGARVFILYRRGREEMPMDELEQIALQKEGIPVYYLVAPIEIISQDGKRVARLNCVRMELQADPKSEGGRRVPVPVRGSEFEVNADIVVPAIAQEPDLAIFPMELNIVTNPNGYTTNIEGVFAAGDFLSGTTDVIKVIAQAHEASIEILKFLGQEPKLPSLPPQPRKLDNSPWYFEDPEKLRREKIYGGWMDPYGERFREVEDCMSKELAIYEATRCLQCDYLVSIDKASCHRCGRCVESCPQKALELVFQETTEGQPGAWFSNGRWYTEDSGVYTKPELCIQCGTCLRACPHQNISFVRHR
ncbi:MAG: FAD-dependent oxidoreductase, partial [Candidatus Brocadiales bacterium]